MPSSARDRSKTSSSSRSRKPGTSSRSTSSGGSSSGRESKGEIEQIGLRQSAQKRLLQDVFEKGAGSVPGWKILVVDETAMRVISSAVGMYDIMERKVTLVESLEKVRAPFKDMSAIYILAPTKESVNKLLADFESKDKVLYGQGIFVFFLGRIPEQVLTQIKQCKYLVKRLKGLSEINLNFLSKEERAFQLEVPNAFKSFYLRNGASPIELDVAEKLVTVCATLNEYPYIRYRQSSGVCSSLASLFHLKMDEFVAQNPDWWYHGSGKSGKKHAERDRSTLLLLDRASDCLTPLMHDFSYQPMVHDLLQMEGDKITYDAESAEDPNIKEPKDVLLNEKDKLWVELRGKHIAKVIEVLSARIQEVVNSSTGSAFSGKPGGNMSLSQMASALKELPEYREIMQKLSQHMHLSHECMDKFKRLGLLDLSEVEQTLATGKDEDGGSPKLTEMISRVESSLIRMTDSKERLRLLLITIVSQNGLGGAERDRLMRAAQLSRDEMQVLNSLEHMGVSTYAATNNSSSGGRFFGAKGKLSSSGSIDEDGEYASQRYVPPLKTICNELATNSLSMEEYPSVVPMPDMPSSSSAAGSARRGGSAKGSARKKKGASSKFTRSTGAETSSGSVGNFQGPRGIIFMVGGISYTEIKVSRDVMEKEGKEIIVGSTSFLSPAEFLSELESLGDH